MRRNNQRYFCALFFVALSFRRFRKVYGGKTSIPYCQGSGYHSTCPITTMLFVDHVLEQFYGSKNAYYTLIRNERACLLLSGTLRSLCATLLKIARRRVAIAGRKVQSRTFRNVMPIMTTNDNLFYRLTLNLYFVMTESSKRFCAVIIRFITPINGTPSRNFCRHL